MARISDSVVLSVVIPTYNEQASLRESHRRLTHVLSRTNTAYELVFVNDGSRDASVAVLHDLRREDPHVSILDLSRNFGKEIALTAGLDVADGDAVIAIDADLQDPPEVIPLLVAEWRKGFDVVYAQRIKREGETWLKRLTARWFYRVMQSVGPIAIPCDTGDFRLLSRRAVLALRRFPEQHRFMKGLFTWIGFPQTAVRYERDARFAGESKWSYWRLWNLALEGVTSFTTVPLRVSTYVGLVTALGAFVYGLFIAMRTVLYGNPVAGYPSLVVIMLFMGGIQLTAIGVLGEYLGRVFNETKRRPLYFVNSHLPAVGVQAQKRSESQPASSVAHVRERR
jgi:glycosyltransferase involved in cell wall biosynthesis